jgi:hypothetical protein
MRATKLLPIAFVASMALVAPEAQAQARTWEFWIGGGPVIPMGELADEARTGVALQGSFVFDLPSLPVDVRADLFYHDSEAVTREPGIDVSYGGEWYRQLGSAIYGQLSVPMGGLNPYGLLGAAMVREWHGDRTFREENQTSLNVNIGVGIEFPLFGVGGFLEARYLNLLGTDELRTGPPAVHREIEFRSIPITFGFRL